MNRVPHPFLPHLCDDRNGGGRVALAEIHTQYDSMLRGMIPFAEDVRKPGRVEHAFTGCRKFTEKFLGEKAGAEAGFFGFQVFGFEAGAGCGGNNDATPILSGDSGILGQHLLLSRSLARGGPLRASDFATSVSDVEAFQSKPQPFRAVLEPYIELLIRSPIGE